MIFLEYLNLYIVYFSDQWWRKSLIWFLFLVFSFSITEFWRGMRQNINLIISNMDWYVFKPYFTFKLWWPFCYVGSKIVSEYVGSKIVSEYDQEIPQSQTADNPVVPGGRAARPSTITRHQEDKLSKATSSLSLPHQDDYNTRMDIK